MKHEYRVKKSERGITLENFLYSKLEDWSHKKIKDAINNKRATVNRKPVYIAGWNLKGNDLVVFMPESGDLESTPVFSRYHYVKVLFEDPYLLVTDKPPYVDYDSFVSQVNAYLKRQKGQGFYPYLGQMHRLDKETSGLLVFTKKKMANTLAHQFRARKIKKDYLAVVWGCVAKDNALITNPLEKKHFPGGKKVSIAPKGQGKESLTEYWVQERYPNATLLRVRLGTGRTHQIRVHLSHLGHPLVGDKIYGKVLESGKNALPIRRQALHAHRLEFIHPVTEKRMRLEAPVPEDMERLIDALREAS